MTVELYRCIPRRCWSVRQDRRVVAHVSALILRDVTFRVSEAGRQRVIRLRQRAVVAWATGTPCEARRWLSAERVRFDPYAGPNFVIGEDVIERAHVAFFESDGSCWAIR